MTGDFDIGFVAGRFVVDGTFESHIKLVTVVGGGLGVVEDSFVRDMDVEHNAHDICCFTGA